jgi:V8-like Glu-specific endopeptidase
MAQFLQIGERNQLVRVLSGVDDFAFAPSRKTALGLANLDRFAAKLGLDASTKQFVGQLVLMLEKYGPLDDQPGVHALGALLGTVIDTDDVPFDDRKFLAQIAVKYTLSSDPAYLEQLREKYHINDQPVRLPLAVKAQMPAPSKLAAAREPDFAIGVADQKGLETIINSEDNFLDLTLLSGALTCARAVCMVEAPEGTPIGTGFLVGPDLVLTNQHVLPSEKMLESVVTRFDYARQPNCPSSEGRVFAVQPDFYQSSPDDRLDYALVRLVEAPLDSLAKAGAHRGYLMLSARGVVDRERVNIIQHPGGRPMQVVLTQNYVVSISDHRLQYVADTMEGSSGSPVFDRNWRVVAIHHSGKPYPPEGAFDSAKKMMAGKWRVNEGIPLKPILEEISRYLPAS